jgi:hypothetical protein
MHKVHIDPWFVKKAKQTRDGRLYAYAILVAWQSSIDRLSPVGSPSRNGLWFDEKENPHGQISGHPRG